MAPVADNACKIPTEADELCIIAVIITPIANAAKGFRIVVKRFLIISTTFSLLLNTDSIVTIPVNKIPSPTIIPAIFFNFFFAKSIINAPTTRRIHARYFGFNRFKIITPPPMSPKLKINDVAVLPKFAPNTTGIA